MRVSEILGLSLVVVACTIAIPACGSSSEKRAATSHADTGLAFTRCMRAHGVTNLPDPAGGGGGLNIASTGINPASPSFRSARASCSKLLPGGGRGTHASEQEIKRDTETAECMREHGVTAFPGPIVTATPPAINQSDYSSAEYGNGIFIGVPKSINLHSPAVEAAAKACNLNG